MIDEVLRSMQHPQRRRIVFSLMEQENREGLAVPDDVRVGDRDVGAQELELYHRHLPILDDSGIVRWDRERGHVRPGPELEEVRALLESIREHDEV